MNKTNIFEDIKMSNQEEFLEIIQKENVKIERIVSTGQTSAKDFWYDQVQNEFVLLIEGEAIIEFEEDKKVHLKKGDYLNIPANKKHRVDFTSLDEPTIWLAVFY
jgi:cupin 2 domain-containing protein